MFITLKQSVYNYITNICYYFDYNYNGLSLYN